MKKFIIFRADRLGDFLIISNIIKAIKDKYPDSHITVVGSPLNEKLIRLYKSIDKIIIYNKDKSFLEKLKIFIQIKKNAYYCSLLLDGKSFSSFLNIFLKANIKLGISYRFYIMNFLIKITWSKPNIFYNFLIFNKFEYFTSKNSLTKIEHLPSKIIKLANNLKLNLNKKKPYFFEVKKKDSIIGNKIFKEKIKGKFVLIHLDEKWEDIDSICNEFANQILIFQKKIKKKIVITSNKNKYLYYKLIKKKLTRKKNIIFLENLDIKIFERIISRSTFAISCHSGYLVQISGFNKTNLIDIVNKKDLIWYNCWKPFNTRHKFILKSTDKKKINLNEIFKKIIIAARSFDV